MLLASLAFMFLSCALNAAATLGSTAVTGDPVAVAMMAAKAAM